MSSHKTAWVVSMDSVSCRIYHYVQSPETLTLLHKIEHPENRSRDLDLTSDKPGHYKNGAVRRGAYVQETDPKEIKREEFTREVARLLDVGRQEQAYGRLIVLALPHINGLLLHTMNKEVKAMISHTLEKNTVHLTDTALLDVLTNLMGR